MATQTVLIKTVCKITEYRSRPQEPSSVPIACAYGYTFYLGLLTQCGQLIVDMSFVVKAIISV